MGCQKNRRLATISTLQRRLARRVQRTLGHSGRRLEKATRRASSAGAIEREFADTYRMTAVARSSEQRLRCRVDVGRGGLSGCRPLRRRALRTRGRAGDPSRDRGPGIAWRSIDRRRDPPGQRPGRVDAPPPPRGDDDRRRGDAARARGGTRRRDVRDRVRRRTSAAARLGSRVPGVSRSMGRRRSTGRQRPAPTPARARSGSSVARRRWR